MRRAMWKARRVTTAGLSAVLVAAGLLLAGLGGPAPAGAANSPIVIGLIGGFTGPLAASVYATPPAFRAWISYVNAHGGINGHQVQLIYKDDQTNPATSQTQISQLIAANPVAIFDESNFDSQWASQVAAAHIPIIPTNSSTVGALESSNFFTAGPTIDTLPQAIAAAAKKISATKMGLLYCAESPDCSQLVTPIKTAASTAGVSLVYNTSISATAPNYTAPCLAAQQAGAKALFIGDAVQVLLSVAKDCVTQGYNPMLIGDDGAVAPSFATAPGWKDGMIAVQPNIPFNVKNTPATATMYAAFNKYQPGFVNNVNFNELAVETWSAGLLFQAAAKAGGLGVNGAPTTAQLYNGLYSRSLQGTTLGGITPPLHFVRGKVTSNGCWFFQRTANGKFTTPYGLKPTCLTNGTV